MSKTRVLLTGASGSMGHEAFLELRRRRDQFDVKLLLRGSKANRKMFAPYQDEDWLHIVWGDLTRPEDVRFAVKGVDAVLHPAALISPAADRAPAAAHAINVGGTAHLLDAVKAEPGGSDRIKFVYIGSVAQYGDRLPPYEMIRVGDPLKPSVHDFYALTKCEAERMVIESGLTHWVSLRQTFICIPNLLSLIDPILFHQPLEQRLEFITARDAGYGLVQCLEVGDDFWRRIYNMSGGPDCRIKYIDFVERQFEIFGLGDPRRIFDRNWFALRNFHCGYYADAHVLDGYLGHFRDTLDDYCEQVERGAATWMKLGARIAPKRIMKLLARRLAEPMDWIEQDNESYINAFFGSRKAWEQIPNWHEGPPPPPDESRTRPPGRIERPAYSHESISDYARSRGGVILASEFNGETSRHRWRCARAHEFDATPKLLLEAGYWCPTCVPTVNDQTGWDWDVHSAVDPLLRKFHRID